MEVELTHGSLRQRQGPAVHHGHRRLDEDARRCVKRVTSWTCASCRVVSHVPSTPLTTWVVTFHTMGSSSRQSDTPLTRAPPA